VSPAPADVPAPLLTVAERSDFRATSRYAEVIELVDRLAGLPPVRRIDLGTTVEGRAIPVLIIADPPVSGPPRVRPPPPRDSDAAGQAGAPNDDRLVVLLLGDIHAGEVDGKEALLMLARELATTPGHPLLQKLILLVAPIYNADGNERFSKTSRPGQVGPEDGQGQRANAAGLDLNRDFIKLEAPETRGLVRLMNEWDPAVFIDTHTTNGCYHRYLITYEGPKTPAGDPHLIRFVRDDLLPQVTRELERRTGYRSFTYGDFNAEHTTWETFPAQPRYSTNYVGLRNRISILSESYSYAPYRDRVLGTLEFVRTCLESVAARHADVSRLLIGADARSIAAGRTLQPADRLALRTRPIPAPTTFAAAGFIEEQKDGKSVPTSQPRDYDVDVLNHFEATLSVQRPAAYIVPADEARVTDLLRLHGVEVQTLTADAELDIEVYRVDRVAMAEAPFQNHRTATVDVTPRRERRMIPRGAALVPTAQRLGSLACYLLEPQAEDGLTTWNAFDAHLAVGRDFPVLRVVGPLPGAP
jgi:hypothetical protein